MRDLTSEIQADIEATSLYDYLCNVLKAANRIIETDLADGFTGRAGGLKLRADKLGELLFELEN